MRQLISQKVLIVLLLTLFLYQTSNARWQTKDDAETEFESYESNIKVNKDGTFEEVEEFTQKILKEGARMRLAKYVMTYKERVSEIKIIDAKTVHKDKEYKVDKKLIEDKPLASEFEGFDQEYQISIPFQKVEVGSKIYLKYQYKQKKVPIKNHFSNIIGFWDGYYNQGKMLIKSEIPLCIEINDPRKVLKVIQKDEKNIEIEITKPFTDQTINDISRGVLNSKNKTWVAVSNSNSWQEIAKPLAIEYKKVINQKLPKRFKEIGELASKEKSEIDQINKVTSSIQEYIHYLKDWKTAYGGWFPRDLKVVDSTQYGDCKDFSAATAAVLNSIGFNANVALVYRGIMNQKYETQLPNNMFNHAITYVKSKTGKEYWVDSTNYVSMAGKIFPDIADRMSLILDDRDSVYKKIGPVNYKTSSITSNTDFIVKNDIVNKSVKAHISGEIAYYFTAMGLFLSKEAIEDALYKLVEYGQSIDKKKRKKSFIPDLKSRIVSDINIQLEYEKDNPFTKTNYGKALKLYSNIVSNFSNAVPNDSVKDFFIGPPRTSTKVIKINSPLKNIENLDFEAKNQWFNISRKCKVKDNNTIIQDKIEILRSYITYKDRQQKLYRKFKKNVERNFSKVSIILP